MCRQVYGLFTIFLSYFVPVMHSSLILNSGDCLLPISNSVLAIWSEFEMGSELGFNNPPKIYQDTNFIKDGLL